MQPWVEFLLLYFKQIQNFIFPQKIYQNPKLCYVKFGIEMPQRKKKKKKSTANRGMMGLMTMVGLTAGAWAMEFVDGGRRGSWWRLSSSDGLEQGDNCGFCAIWVIVLGVGWLWGESLWCFDHFGWLDLGRLGDFRFVGMDANWLILLVPVMVSWILVWKGKIVMDWGLLWY